MNCVCIPEWCADGQKAARAEVEEEGGEGGTENHVGFLLVLALRRVLFLYHILFAMHGAHRCGWCCCCCHTVRLVVVLLLLCVAKS